MLSALAAERFVLDGELAIEIGGRLAFDALQMRLHPAESRIRKLSAETPARLIMFDMLAAPDGPVVIDKPLQERRHRLEDFTAEAGIPKRFVLSPATTDLPAAKAWLRDSGYGATDGVVAKQLARAYEPGERAMIKVKQLRTLTASSAASAMKATAGRSDRCFSDSTTPRAGSTMSASLPPLPTKNGQA
jgi:ATP-dependent DNA ligase